METGGGGCHTAVDVAIDGLVVGGVACLGASVQVGWDGDFADSVEYVGEGAAHVATIPVKGDFPSIASLLATGGGKGDLVAIDGDNLGQ